MGRQINFYMSENVQNQFIQYLINNDFLFLDGGGKKIEFSDLCSDNIYSYYLYKIEFGCLLTKGNGNLIDVLDSPIIEFLKTRIKGNKMLRGRLWVSTYYYKDNGQTEESKKYIVEYQKLVRWIKKNVPYQDIKKGEYLIKEYANDELIQMEKDGYIFTA